MKKRKANSQAESSLVKKSPDKSATDNDESRLEPRKSRKNHDSNRPQCPKCKASNNVIKIIYGFPTADTMDLAEQGKLKLGGCCITGNNPQWFCKRCEEEF